MKRKSPIWIALAAGFALSGLLFTVFWTSPHPSNILFCLQWPGFLVCWLQPGSLESATLTQYGLIGLPINGAFYGAIIYILLRVFGRAKSVTRA